MSWLKRNGKQLRAYLPEITVIGFIVLAVFSKALASPYPFFISGEIPDAGSNFPWFKNTFAETPDGVSYRKLATEPDRFSIFSPVPYGPLETNLENRLMPPSFDRFGHYMGTDELGRDVFARIIHGTANSMLVGLVAVGIALIAGILIGSLAGYFGGYTDLIISRFIEIVICFPTLILIMVVLSLLKPSLLNIMVVIGITGWTGIARVIRSEFLKRKKMDYVTAARSLGSSHARIIFLHILPNSLGPVLVMTAFGIASAVITESALSFLGIGVPAPEPSWGQILKVSQEYPDIAWWLTFYPGLFIFITVLAYNYLGDKYRKILNPRE